MNCSHKNIQIILTDANDDILMQETPVTNVNCGYHGELWRKFTAILQGVSKRYFKSAFSPSARFLVTRPEPCVAVSTLIEAEKYAVFQLL